MPGMPILHVGATVVCMHGGQATPVLANPRVMVSGQPVVTITCAYAIAGCGNPPPPANVGPCVTATWASAAIRVRAGGLPVLLQNSQAVCVPTGGRLNVVLTQQKVTAT
jgi:hypothetical protein